MTTIQIVFLVLAILATLYQFIKVGEIHALVARYGGVHVRASLYLMFALTVAIQVAFVLTLAGGIA